MIRWLFVFVCAVAMEHEFAELEVFLKKASKVLPDFVVWTSTEDGNIFTYESGVVKYDKPSVVTLGKLVATLAVLRQVGPEPEKMSLDSKLCEILDWFDCGVSEATISQALSQTTGAVVPDNLGWLAPENGTTYMECAKQVYAGEFILQGETTSHWIGEPGKLFDHNSYHLLFALVAAEKVSGIGVEDQLKSVLSDLEMKSSSYEPNTTPKALLIEEFVYSNGDIIDPSADLITSAEDLDKLMLAIYKYEVPGVSKDLIEKMEMDQTVDVEFSGKQKFLPAIANHGHYAMGQWVVCADYDPRIDNTNFPEICASDNVLMHGHIGGSSTWFDRRREFWNGVIVAMPAESLDNYSVGKAPQQVYVARAGKFLGRITKVLMNKILKPELYSDSPCMVLEQMWPVPWQLRSIVNGMFKCNAKCKDNDEKFTDLDNYSSCAEMKEAGKCDGPVPGGPVEFWDADGFCPYTCGYCGGCIRHNHARCKADPKCMWNRETRECMEEADFPCYLNSRHGSCTRFQRCVWTGTECVGKWSMPCNTYKWYNGCTAEENKGRCEWKFQKCKDAEPKDGESD